MRSEEHIFGHKNRVVLRHLLQHHIHNETAQAVLVRLFQQDQLMRGTVKDHTQRFEHRRGVVCILLHAHLLVIPVGNKFLVLSEYAIDGSIKFEEFDGESLGIRFEIVVWVHVCIKVDIVDDVTG
jgi:hypothetical protein